MVCKVKKNGQWGRVSRVGKGRGQGKDRNATPGKAELRSGREVIPSAVQCRGEKMARRGRVWRNAMQGQSMDEQPDEAGVAVVVRFVVFLALVAQWGKEGGDGPTV